jgi:hypothetical protein
VKTKRVRLTLGQNAGTVQTVPAAVAERLLEAGHATAVDEQEDARQEAIDSGDPDVHHRDPRSARRK